MKNEEKVRLINAERLKSLYVFREPKGRFYQGVIDAAPTVDAIPVEWLKKQAITHGQVVNGEYWPDDALAFNEAVKTILERWREYVRDHE